MSKKKTNRAGGIQIGGGKTSTEEFIERSERFLAHLDGRRYSPRSVEKRRGDLRRFFLYLDGLGIERLRDVDLKGLESFHRCLVDHGYKDTVIESCLRAAKLFFDFLQEEGILFENPARKLKIPKPPARVGTVLTEKEMKRVLAAPDLTSAEGIRDRAMMETLYTTGIRRGELMALATHNVDLDRATLRVQGKGKKVRLLPLGRKAVKYLKLYIQHARPGYLPPDGPAPDALWLGCRREPIKITMLECVLIRYCRAVGIKGKVGVHVFRRSCATHMLQNGAHPVVVARLLGHSNLSTLAHYLRTTITDLKKAHAKTVLGR